MRLVDANRALCHEDKNALDVRFELSLETVSEGLYTGPTAKSERF
jgi:hypothetical protein